ncbi:LysR family transcriptional regulator [Quisquiliibacterium transsilvanicum]|uniref:DNA-binding transcriptional LysR family regulator n=1 Tax=Quisquiliibacterium transsilvanicum TaxID=1549638 RepID=A0A7W8M9A9_9BURK|nr:LysR family transcriptional regulator [Quisquiliibacterium transsilvanicum]MBB5272517.1 DNA-binding transcriptional LysR family regulator [Quisquiliibacterium transsilvanicum]
MATASTAAPAATPAAASEGLPDANDLLLFACVMEAGSFSRAAQRCGLPKSTVSRRIAALEAGLGERLLTRTTRQLAITEFGERILDHARRLLEETEAAHALAQHRQAAPRGTLRVSLPPDFDELNLPALLPGFVAVHPEVRVELDLSPRRADLVAERFDLAVRVAARLPDDATLVARRIADLGYGLYASPDYLERAGRPVSPQELPSHAGLRLIVSGGEVQPWRLASGAERCEVLPSGPLAANSIGLLRELAARGMGIAGLSERQAAPLLASGRLERVLPDWRLPTMTVWGVTPGRRLTPARVDAFLEAVRAALKQDSSAVSPDEELPAPAGAKKTKEASNVRNL